MTSTSASTADAESPTTYKGGCLCGAVAFEVEGPLPAPTACHCSQCRKQSGHYWASTEVPRSAVRISGEDHVSWFRASEKAQRGFCATCGSFLFWQALNKDTLDLAMGAFENTTDIRLARHIFVADKGGYYELGDGVPQNMQ